MTALRTARKLLERGLVPLLQEGELRVLPLCVVPKAAVHLTGTERQALRQALEDPARLLAELEGTLTPVERELYEDRGGLWGVGALGPPWFGFADTVRTYARWRRSSV